MVFGCWNTRLCFSVFSFILFLSSHNVHADINMGGLSSLLKSGQSGLWQIHHERGSVVLENAQGEGDITYYYVGHDPSQEGARKATVTVQLLNTTGYSWAGLLYGYVENPRSYYIFAIQPNNQVTLVQRTPSGFEQRLSQTVRSDVYRPNQLSIKENGNSIDLFVNGKNIGSYGNSSIGRGTIGIAAGDMGAYRFKGFDVQVEGGAAKARTSYKKSPAPSKQSNQVKNKKQEDFVYEEIFDPKFNMVSMRMPIPSSWESQKRGVNRSQGNDNNVEYKTKGGTLIYYPRHRLSYFQSGNPMLDSIVQQRGALLEPYQPLSQLMQGVLMPAMRDQGARLLKTYKVPELLNFHRQELTDDPWNTYQFETWAADWALPNGDRLATLSVQALSSPTQRTLQRSNGYVLKHSLIITRAVEGPPQYFEKAKQELLVSVANIEVNAVWKQTQYNDHVKKMAQIEADGHAALLASQQRHNANMARQNSDAQRRLSQTYSEISDITASGYTTRSNIQYQGHKSSVNGILERTNIYGSNGSSYSVPAGSNHYWVNQNTGRYVATDNPLFDPRKNTELTGQWERFQQR